MAVPDIHTGLRSINGVQVAGYVSEDASVDEILSALISGLRRLDIFCSVVKCGINIEIMFDSSNN